MIRKLMFLLLFVSIESAADDSKQWKVDDFFRYFKSSCEAVFDKGDADSASVAKKAQADSYCQCSANYIAEFAKDEFVKLQAGVMSKAEEKVFDDKVTSATQSSFQHCKHFLVE